MNVRLVILSFVAAVFSLQGTSFGEITLHINSATKTLWFSGNASGSLNVGPPFEATWLAGSGITPDESIVTTTAFTPMPDVGAQLDVFTDGSNPTGLSLSLYYSADQTSLTAVSSSVFDYSFMTPQNEAYLDGLAAGPMALTAGTGWQPITISPVPEPSAFVLLGAVGLFGGAIAGASRLKGGRKSG